MAGELPIGAPNPVVLVGSVIIAGSGRSSNKNVGPWIDAIPGAREAVNQQKAAHEAGQRFRITGIPLPPGGKLWATGTGAASAPAAPPKDYPTYPGETPGVRPPAPPGGPSNLPRSPGFPPATPGEVGVGAITKRLGAYFEEVLARWGGYIWATSAAYIWDLIHGNEIRENEGHIAEAKAEEERIRAEIGKAIEEAKQRRAQREKEARQDKVQRLKNIQAMHDRERAEIDKEYKKMVDEEARRQKAEAERTKKIAQASAAQMARRVAIATAGVGAAASIIGGLLTRPKASSQSVQVAAPTSATLTPRSTDLGVTGAGFLAGLGIGAGQQPLLSDLTGIEGLPLSSADPDVVCYRKSARKKRRKPAGKRICYTRKV